MTNRIYKFLFKVSRMYKLFAPKIKLFCNVRKTVE